MEASSNMAPRRCTRERSGLPACLDQRQSSRPAPRGPQSFKALARAARRCRNRQQGHRMLVPHIAAVGLLERMTSSFRRTYSLHRDVRPDTLTLTPGRPEPLGPSAEGRTAVNFALFSEHATGVSLVLRSARDEPLAEFPLDPAQHRTGRVWHACVHNCPRAGLLYGFKVAGLGGWETGHRWDPNKVLLDPYAPLVRGRSTFGVRDTFERFEEKVGSVFRGTFDLDEPPFDWGRGYRRPRHAPQDLIVYEMGVRCFTASPSSGVGADRQGTFAGLAAKVPHLVDLGVTAVELLPIFEFDELEFQRQPNPRDHMVNIWGYSHLSFLAPMSRFGSGGRGPAVAAREFKECVRALHNAGIQVILDVVFNHTAEGGDDDPYLLSWRGIDNSAYYMLDKHAYTQMLNYSGCGNTVAANHPPARELILTACRRWVEEFHVDGFRFDLAAALCRDRDGTPLAAPPLIRALAKDPVLSQVHLIAEPWDCGGLYQVGSFPNWDVWAEWNGRFRDDVRRFVKGDPATKTVFATRLCGSADLYNRNNRKPYHSINYVVAHDGFTLHDLVAYNAKHNDANGEGNRDGSNDNHSWNCGAEGETADAGVLALRGRQMRNLHAALMLAQGTPMLLSGDEYASTRRGNNNWYGHDTELTRFDWRALEAQRDTFYRFYRGLIHFRRQHPLLGRADFLSERDVTWHEDNWDDPGSKFLAFTLHGRELGCSSLYVAFNAHEFEVTAPLPAAPEGAVWARVVDTQLAAPADFTPDDAKPIAGSYILASYSCIILQSRAAPGEAAEDGAPASSR